MSYSRRQLYAFGEPLGDGATRREVGGKTVYGSGGGDSTPEKQTTVVDIPDWAKPYAKESLGKAAALTSTPYQTYGGERIAQFTPMQKQAFGRAEGQEVASQIGAGSGLAGTAGLMGLTGGYQPGQFGSQMSQYMSPYMDAVVQQQMESAQRQADIAGTQRGAQAVRAGAFGGSRQAIENAEAARALASQKGQIQATGLQSAYDRAADMYGREQALAEQSRQAGLGTALTAAGQLGQLGQQQFGQQMDITGQQAQFGGQQRAATQDILSQQYQDFLNQQRSPYDQLSFMSSIIRGTPMGQTTTQYAPPPSTTSQLIGLGTAAAGAYGAYKGAAGGEIPSYATGGIASLNQPEMAAATRGMDDQQVASTADMAGLPGLTAGAEQQRRNELRMAAEGQKAPASMTKITSVLSQMSDAELQQYAKLNKSDPYTMALVVSEANRRKEGGMPTQKAPTVVEQQIAGMALPEEMGIAQLPVGDMQFADGGIIAFDQGGVIRLPKGTPDEEVETIRMQNPDQTVVVEGQADLYRDTIRPFFTGYSDSARKLGRPDLVEGLSQRGTTAGIAALADGSDSRFQRGPVVAGITDQPPAPDGIKQLADKAGAGAPNMAGIGAAPSSSGYSDILKDISAREKQLREGEAAATKMELAGMEKERTELEAAKEEAKKYGTEQEEKYKKRGERLDKDEKMNVYKTMIDAGLAMAAGKSPDWVQNLAVGAQQGLKGYEARLTKVNEGRDELDDAMFKLYNIRNDKLTAVGDKKRELNRAQTRAEADGQRALNKISESAFGQEINVKTKEIDQIYKTWETRYKEKQATERTRISAETRVDPLTKADYEAKAELLRPLEMMLSLPNLAPEKRATVQAQVDNIKREMAAMRGGGGKVAGSSTLPPGFKLD